MSANPKVVSLPTQPTDRATRAYALNGHYRKLMDAFAAVDEVATRVLETTNRPEVAQLRIDQFKTGHAKLRRERPIYDLLEDAIHFDLLAGERANV